MPGPAPWRKSFFLQLFKKVSNSFFFWFGDFVGSTASFVAEATDEIFHAYKCALFGFWAFVLVWVEYFLEAFPIFEMPLCVEVFCYALFLE